MWALVAVVVAVVIGAIVLGAWLFRPRSVSTERFDALVSSGTFAGIRTHVQQGPAAPSIDVDAKSQTFFNEPSCIAYWQLAATRATRAAALAPDSPAEAGATAINAQLWESPDAAAQASTAWQTCLADYAAANPTGYPMEVIDSGTADGVAWVYYADLTSGASRHILDLRRANVIASFELPDGPDPLWRESLIASFAADVRSDTA